MFLGLRRWLVTVVFISVTHTTPEGKPKIDGQVKLAKLLNTMRQFKDAVELAHYLLLKKKLKESEVKRRSTRLLSNA